jgi:predicted nuclease with RNAse H fold
MSSNDDAPVGQPVFIGVDTTAGVRPMTVVVLDNDLNIIDLSSKPALEVVDIIAAYPRAICGVDAPIMPNRGLLADPAYRASVDLPSNQSNYRDYRVCEFELRRRGMYIYHTPADPDRVPRWIAAGWELYNRLRAVGFVDYSQPGPRRMFETYPHGAFTTLLEKRPYPKTGIEGRIQRQLLLYHEGVDIPDPLFVLQSWTPHQFLTGSLDMARIHTHDELDALVAAYTAYLLDCEPQHTVAVGDERDGQIVLPTGDLLDYYD